MNKKNQVSHALFKESSIWFHFGRFYSYELRWKYSTPVLSKRQYESSVGA